MKEIELFWFDDIKRMGTNKIVLVWECTGNGRKYIFVYLVLYRILQEIKLC
jgi:hypothetical protein